MKKMSARSLWLSLVLLVFCGLGCNATPINVPLQDNGTGQRDALADAGLGDDINGFPDSGGDSGPLLDGANDAPSGAPDADGAISDGGADGDGTIGDGGDAGDAGDGQVGEGVVGDVTAIDSAPISEAGTGDASAD